jgi:hypothetical protein
MVQVQPLHRAHSHNDYEQKKPLELALSEGFGSVEADVFLVDGALLVSHNRKDCDPLKTLDTLYLKPLWKRFQAKEHLPDILLVDVKADAVEAWKELRREVEPYRAMLATPSQAGVQVIVSGERARDLIFADDLTAFDGRPEDFDAPISWSLPLISMSWDTVFKWKGDEVKFSGEERARLTELVRRAHEKGRKIRFWATADTPAMWEELWNAGVDLIGTDQPAKLGEFLRKKG